MDRKLAAKIGAAPLLAAGVWVGWTLPSGDGAGPSVKLVEVPTPPAPTTIVHELSRGETLADVFETQGMSGAEIFEVVEAIREYESPRRLRPGTEVRFSVRPRSGPLRISLRLDRDRTLHLFPEAEAADPWVARLDSVPVVRDTIVLAGLVGSNLYDAELFGDVERLGFGELHEVAFRLSQIMGWEIDFTRDLRTHDAFRVAIAREVRPDGSVRSGRMLAAEFRNRGREITAVRYQPDPDDRVEYYDADGQALRGTFLLAPLDLARVTSGFNLRRFHPVLKRRRPHRGVDYGAPRGTPVRATGGGVVFRAGPWGGYGTAVEVRHANQLRTRYAHLSGIAKGVRRGIRVEQGQIIGYVGATGLATGAHLHYEFLRNGTQVNPARMNFPKAEPVPDELRADYEATSREALALLSRVSMPSSAVASAARPVQD